MQLTTTLLTLALATVPISALPGKTGEELQARSTIVTCKPDKNDWFVQDFKVDLDRALEQANKGGNTTGKSGDPHLYGNGDGIKWGLKGCNKKDIKKWEYPIYWEGKKIQGGKVQEWQKDGKSKDQDITPLRGISMTKGRMITES